MKKEYSDWIQKNGGSLFCYSTAIEMAKVFPELILVEGEIITGERVSGEPDRHFWCETGSGEIVDPTGPFQAEAHGFTILRYQKWKTHDVNSVPEW